VRSVLDRCRLFVLGDTGVVFGIGVPVAVMFTQVVVIGNAGRRQTSRSHRINALAGPPG
jgi:hypothetical protein